MTIHSIRVRIAIYADGNISVLTKEVFRKHQLLHYIIFLFGNCSERTLTCKLSQFVLKANPQTHMEIR